MVQAARRSKPLRRQAGTRPLGKHYLVYCEGKITEQTYLDGVACFELWLLLHFCDHTGHLSTDSACKLLESRKYCGYTVADKRFDVVTVLPLKQAAADRAGQLAKKHTQIPLEPRNPGSTFHLLLDSLRNGSPGR